jgi:hypothetical protein
MLAVAILLFAESLRMFGLAYAVLHIHLVYFPGSPYFSSMLTTAIWGVLLFVTAGLCLMYQSILLRWISLPAIGMVCYGSWDVYNYGQSMISVSRIWHGDDVSLGYIAGIGFVAIGALALIARWLNESK